MNRIIFVMFFDSTSRGRPANYLTYRIDYIILIGYSMNSLTIAQILCFLVALPALYGADEPPGARI